MPPAATAFRTVGLCLCAAAGAAAQAPAPSAPAESLRRYVSLVERYRQGERRSVVSELRIWGNSAGGAPGLVEAWKEAREQEVAFAGLAQAAALLHTDLALLAAEAGDTREHERQFFAIRTLLRRLHARERAHLPPPGRSPSARDLYVGIASAELAIGAVPEANTLLVEYAATEAGRAPDLRNDTSLAEYPPSALGLGGYVHVGALIARHFSRKAPDAELLLLAGCGQEILAHLIRQTKAADHGPRGREALRRAEDFFRATLEVAPDLPEARLRLGWVLLRRGERDESQTLLEAAARNAPDARRGQLAWLFLGRLREQRGENPAALEAYERASALVPDAWSARLALARARERTRGYGAARELLQPLLEGAGPEGPGRDPWTDYVLGPEEMRLRLLDTLLVRVRWR